MDVMQVAVWIALALIGVVLAGIVVRFGLRMGLGVASTMLVIGGLVLLGVGGLVGLAYVVIGPGLGAALEPAIAVYWAAWMLASGLAFVVGLGVKIVT